MRRLLGRDSSVLGLRSGLALGGKATFFDQSATKLRESVDEQVDLVEGVGEFAGVDIEAQVDLPTAVGDGEGDVGPLILAPALRGVLDVRQDVATGVVAAAVQKAAGVLTVAHVGSPGQVRNSACRSPCWSKQANRSVHASSAAGATRFFSPACPPELLAPVRDQNEPDPSLSSEPDRTDNYA